MALFCSNKKINTDYLKLAQIVYGGEYYYSLRKYKLKPVRLVDSKFEQIQDILLKKIGNTSFYSYKNENSGFVANLFENIKNGELVIAYRGTERYGLGENYSNLSAVGKDVLTDLNLTLGNPDEQFEDAYLFYQLVKNQNPSAKITIVGQSLGGALAQIVAAKEYSINNKKLKTFTYNAPGCKHLLEIIGCNPALNYSFITNYAVMNDWCGMFGENIGDTYLIPPIIISKTESNSPVNILQNVLLTTHEGIFDYSGNVVKKPNNFNQIEGLSLWYFDKNNPMQDFDKPSDFIASLTKPFNTPQLESIGKSWQNFQENFIKEQNAKVQEIYTQIQTATNDFISTQKEKLMEEFNNNTITQFAQVLDSAISQLNSETLENALSVVKELVDEQAHNIYSKSFN